MPGKYPAETKPNLYRTDASQYSSSRQAQKRGAGPQGKIVINSDIFTTITNYATPLKTALLAYQKAENALALALDALSETENTGEPLDNFESILLIHSNLARHKANCINRLRECRADVTEATEVFQALWAKNCAEEDALKNLFGEGK